jgi:serine/arginine repetitive matrix protein 2
LRGGGAVRVAMYNGIGLATVRGSGTNGYVQKNWSHVNRKSNIDYRNEQKAIEKRGPPKQRKPDAGILEHDRKRRVELRIAEFEDAMEEQGYSEEEIEKEVAALRKKMASEDIKIRDSTDGGRRRETESHKVAEQKEKEMAQIANAFGIEKNYASGSSFNAELQAEKREREKMEREVQKKEREQAWKQREADRAERAERDRERPSRDERSSRDDRGRRDDDRDRRDDDRGRGARGGRELSPMRPRSRDDRDSGGHDRRDDKEGESSGGGWDKSGEDKDAKRGGWDDREEGDRDRKKPRIDTAATSRLGLPVRAKGDEQATTSSKEADAPKDKAGAPKDKADAPKDKADAPKDKEPAAAPEKKAAKGRSEEKGKRKKRRGSSPSSSSSSGSGSSSDTSSSSSSRSSSR